VIETFQVGPTKQRVLELNKSEVDIILFLLNLLRLNYRNVL